MRPLKDSVLRMHSRELLKISDEFIGAPSLVTQIMGGVRMLGDYNHAKVAHCFPKTDVVSGVVGPREQCVTTVEELMHRQLAYIGRDKVHGANTKTDQGGGLMMKDWQNIVKEVAKLRSYPMLNFHYENIVREFGAADTMLTYYGSVQTHRGLRADQCANLRRKDKETSLNKDGTFSEVIVLNADAYKNSAVTVIGESDGVRTHILEQMCKGMTNEKYDYGDTAYDTRGTYGEDHICDAIPFGLEILKVLEALHEDPTMEWLGDMDARQLVFKGPEEDLIFIPAGSNGLAYNAGNLKQWSELPGRRVITKQAQGKHLSSARLFS